MLRIRGQYIRGIKAAAFLSFTLLLAACGGGGGGGGEDTTTDGNPLSSDSDTQTDAGISASEDAGDAPIIDIPISLPILTTGDGCLSTAALEATIIQLINEARTQVQQCGDTEFAATVPLTWDERLEGAALTHSQDMANNLFFGHQGTDSSFVGDRVTALNYDWRSVGENLAAGQSTIEQVMQDWMDSPPHCANIMNANFRNVGVSCGDNGSLTFSRYWTMVLGSGRN